MEQPANPAARVRHHTRPIPTSTQNTSIWSVTAAAPSNSVFHALCTNLLTINLLAVDTTRHCQYVDADYAILGQCVASANNEAGVPVCGLYRLAIYTRPLVIGSGLCYC